MGGRETGYLSQRSTRPAHRNQWQSRAFIEQFGNIQPGSIRSEPGAEAVSLFQKLEKCEIKTYLDHGHPTGCFYAEAEPRDSRLERAECVIVQDAYHPRKLRAMPTSASWARFGPRLREPWLTRKNGHPHAEGGRAVWANEARLGAPWSWSPGDGIR